MNQIELAIEGDSQAWRREYRYDIFSPQDATAAGDWGGIGNEGRLRS